MPPPRYALIFGLASPAPFLPSSVLLLSSTSTQALRTQEHAALQTQDSRQNQNSRCASGDSPRQDLLLGTASFSMPTLKILATQSRLETKSKLKMRKRPSQDLLPGTLVLRTYFQDSRSTGAPPRPVRHNLP
ncbi:hypothetical protein C8J57DRAFT_1374077 [Mycena rebaudengoi]|nr:hypothetical protein C8J57DRAFT_1374077 [Mycena rebaudengoi]